MNIADITLGSDDGLIHQLMMLLLVLLAAGVLYFMGWWFATRPRVAQAAPIALTIWNGLFILIGGIIVINFLLSMGNHGFIKW